MPWWSWRPGQAGGEETGSRRTMQADRAVRIGPPAQRTPSAVPCPASSASAQASPPPAAGPTTTEAAAEAVRVQVTPVTLGRVSDALDLLDVRYLADGDGSLLAMWERHAVLFTLEGPDDEILVMRARPHATVPPDWADHAYRVVNEWNHTRRFCKAYVGDPTERGQLPIYAEMQVPLSAGAHDALLVEMLDCGAAVATSFVDGLHDEGALL